MKKFLALLLAAMMVLSFAACGNETDEPVDQPETPAEPEDVEAVVAELKSLANKEYGVDYISLYEQFGADTTIADVEEDPETGFAYIERDGVKYELGLDFLTMAMVYNVEVPEGGWWQSADDVYANWW